MTTELDRAHTQSPPILDLTGTFRTCDLEILTRSTEAIGELATTVMDRVAAAVAPFARVSVEACTSHVAGERIPSTAITIFASYGIDGMGLADAFRELPVAVLGRTEAHSLVLDLRGLLRAAEFLDQLPRLKDAIRRRAALCLDERQLS